MKPINLVPSLLLALLPGLLWSLPAAAHQVVPGYTGVVGGFMHPFLVLAEALALAALGIVMAQQKQRRRLLLLGTFAGAFVAGTILLALATKLDDAVTPLLIAALALGGLAVVGWSWPLLLTAPLSALIGVLLVFDAVPPIASIPETLKSLLGTFVAALFMLAVLAAFALVPGRFIIRLGLRIAGAWIVASALLAVALRLVR